MRNSSAMLAAASVLLLSGSVASAATAVVTSDLNVRRGQGTNHGVIGVIPGGSQVNATGCGDGWCYVREYGGFASAKYIDTASGAYAASVPGNRVQRRKSPRFYGPPNWRHGGLGTSHYVPGNRLDYRQSPRFYGPPDWRHGDLGTSSYVPGNRLEYRRSPRFFGPDQR